MPLNTVNTQNHAELGADATAGEEEINIDEMIDETEETVNEEEIDENDINIDELLAEFGLSEEEEVEEGRKKKSDPKKGTGKKPEGSSRRLYTDEDPKDTVSIKFKTKEDIVDTLNKKQFKAKAHARQPNNLYELAYMFGYKPNVTQVATTNIDFYQQVPAVLSGSTYIPDYNYSLFIGGNSTISSPVFSSTFFIIEDPVDFSVSSSGDPTEAVIYSVDNSNNPTFYLLKKTRKATSGTINTTQFSFGAPQQFSTVTINANRIIGVLDIFDTDSNEWYEVDYLAQETIFNSIKNTNINDPNLSQYSGDAPYLLKLEQVQRRFVTRVIDTGSLQIQFGAGSATDTDEEITPNPDNVGIGLPFEKDKLTTAYSPSNFLFTLIPILENLVLSTLLH